MSQSYFKTVIKNRWLNVIKLNKTKTEKIRNWKKIRSLGIAVEFTAGFSLGPFVQLYSLFLFSIPFRFRLGFRYAFYILSWRKGNFLNIYKDCIKNTGQGVWRGKKGKLSVRAKLSRGGEAMSLMLHSSSPPLAPLHRREHNFLLKISWTPYMIKFGIWLQ